MHGRAIRSFLCLLTGAPLQEMENWDHSNLCLYELKFNGKDNQLIYKVVSETNTKIVEILNQMNQMNKYDKKTHFEIIMNQGFYEENSILRKSERNFYQQNDFNNIIDQNNSNNNNNYLHVGWFVCYCSFWVSVCISPEGSCRYHD